MTDPQITPDMSDINASCTCLHLNRADIDANLTSGINDPEVEALLKERTNLFARTPVFVQSHHVTAMLQTVAAVEALSKLDGFRDHVFARNGQGQFSSSSPGVAGNHAMILGYDFHLTEQGPSLIEVNTNAGGAFIISRLMHAVEPEISCCFDAKTYGSFFSPAATDKFLSALFCKEWVASGRTGKPKTLAIVDKAPRQQYLYPEMLLAKNLLAKNDIKTIIADPSEFEYSDGILRIGQTKIDMVYNRLTDFSLDQPAHTALRNAYCENAVLLSPSPADHAIFADKRNLILFGNRPQLQTWGLPEQHIIALASVPGTKELNQNNSDELWQQRKKYFFKPNDGHGSKAAYRGSKLTKRVWDEIRQGGHVAQNFTPPPLRSITLDDGPAKLKYDVRLYTYNGEAFAMAARVYQGQTTNFRTPGGGFALVIVVDAAASIEMC